MSRIPAFFQTPIQNPTEFPEEPFSEINKIPYEGPSSKNPLAFKHYNASEIVEGRTMEEQLRFSVVGLNFDAKVRRESFDPIDLFYAHIGGMDAFARGLKIAAAIRAD
ncbi:MAG: hypothetical protein WBW78_00345, partial [Terrimicrobiaceae bacterium]